MYLFATIILAGLIFYLAPAKKESKVEIINPEFEQIERETKDRINQIAVEIEEENKSRSEIYTKK